MARQRIVPIAVALALTVAAGLSITEEHSRKHAPVTGGPLPPHAATDPAALSNAAARPAASVGSRALIGE